MEWTRLSRPPHSTRVGRIFCVNADNGGQAIAASLLKPSCCRPYFLFCLDCVVLPPIAQSWKVNCHWSFVSVSFNVNSDDPNLVNLNPIPQLMHRILTINVSLILYLFAGSIKFLKFQVLQLQNSVNYVVFSVLFYSCGLNVLMTWFIRSSCKGSVRMRKLCFMKLIFYFSDIDDRLNAWLRISP